MAVIANVFDLKKYSPWEKLKNKNPVTVFINEGHDQDNKEKKLMNRINHDTKSVVRKALKQQKKRSII